jgi:hypothetical protein
MTECDGFNKMGKYVLYVLVMFPFPEILAASGGSQGRKKAETALKMSPL